MKKYIFILILVLMFTFSGKDFIFSSAKPEIYFFYSATCPHCIEEKGFLKGLKEKYPEINLKEYEIISNIENQKVLKSFYKKYNVPKGEMGRVPVTFTSAKYFIGFNQKIAQDIESCLKQCLLSGKEKESSYKIKIPFYGIVDLSKMSLLVLTITLGALDGLNPCAMWVLLLLIALAINTRSRKKIWLIGGTFILASGIVYFLILSAWLNLFLAIGYVNLTRFLIGIFALSAGVWQIKNFITYRPGVCKIVGMKSGLEKKIKEKTEKIVGFSTGFAMIGGLILLALGVNLIEFFCSAGLPAIYTRILALNQISSLSYYLYLLLYTFIFMLDDLIIFSLAAITLSKIGFTEKYNYWSTLIGGLLMFILGILLIFNPQLLMLV
ncbi:hypothetical protein COY61_01780 [bacterium (Candidatus Gribaldobacteria) CG_4_10_14_0_8_um_filter_33_9]|uniref:Uncharacterized protein n=1 Tax=bacterium (Candidatus Gribaldobacteria) CG_4_10_14_0_8_um_filter_33_9 TaxID=2014266 RepID=A0A2M7RNN7_9BACT|nr:MAG: hypothetical protein COY61_01780 [bacterium (Candidatus Gribaldobacteria) CG_4_10_14_0_8_um_filter_33_9]